MSKQKESQEPYLNRPFQPPPNFVQPDTPWGKITDEERKLCTAKKFTRQYHQNDITTLVMDLNYNAIFVDHFYSQFLEPPFLSELLTNPNPRLIKDILPPPPENYKERTFISRRHIDKKVFIENKIDVYIIQGAQRYQLYFLAGREVSCTTETQIRQKKLTARHLQYTEREGEEWSYISKKAEVPLHWVTYINTNEVEDIYWRKSQGSLEGLYNWILDDSQQETFGEDGLIEKLDDHPLGSHAILSCAPGKGQTLLLQSLAHKLKARYPQRMHLFVNMSSFIEKLRGVQEDKDVYIKALSHLICDITLEYELVKIHFKNPKRIHFEIVMDGIDDLNEEDLKEAEKFLKVIHIVNPARVWITCKPELRNRLENVLMNLAWNVKPI